MKYMLLLISLMAIVYSCENGHRLSNTTRPGGYAMGERIVLQFSLPKSGDPPDSIDVEVLERKTGYTYSLQAGLEDCPTVCRYVCVWDGRKPDGQWPAGGPYLVYATAKLKRTVYSDTVEIGLAD